MNPGQLGGTVCQSQLGQEAPELANQLDDQVRRTGIRVASLIHLEVGSMSVDLKGKRSVSP
jgi:hypothetical protein